MHSLCYCSYYKRKSFVKQWTPFLHVRHSLVGSALQINNIFMNTCMKERQHHKEDIKTLKRLGKRIYDEQH